MHFSSADNSNDTFIVVVKKLSSKNCNCLIKSKPSFLFFNSRPYLLPESWKAAELGGLGLRYALIRKVNTTNEKVRLEKPEFIPAV